MKRAIAALLLFSCGGISTTPEQVCTYFQQCSESYNNKYDYDTCLKDVSEIESRCSSTADDVKSCLVKTSCVNDPQQMLTEIFSCYGLCET